VIYQLILKGFFMMFDDERYDSAFEHEIDFQPFLQPAREHAIEIQPGDYTQRGRLYTVVHNGKVLIRESYDPELDACRKLLELGLKGKLTTYRGDQPCMVLDIEKAAQLSVRENHSGTPVFVKYREGH
jgi:hypothetical protein